MHSSYHNNKNYIIIIISFIYLLFLQLEIGMANYKVTFFPNSNGHLAVLF
jgi:hypothetical protein